ncbi:MAG: SUMF1/EgtB/PvdO family nonheme iron enzyme [Treponema sp.]|jgi:formylglycine-generating enzyme required for sulfatase activity|nr:SUMF1/EgtB/PvdO family nonheme iron enzyme [Treponema sp.]
MNELLLILKKIIADRGGEVLKNSAKCTALLKDYAKGDFGGEIRLLARAIEKGFPSELLRSHGNLAFCKKQLSQRLQKNDFIIPKAADAIINVLVDALNLEAMPVLDFESAADKECPSCGFWIPDNCRFCPQCGVSILEQELPPFFVKVNAGSFTMGSIETGSIHNTAEIPHTVTLRAFFMAQFEVTQKEYRAIMGENPSQFQGENLPVENVSWYDGIEYCNKRSEIEHRTPAYTINKELQDRNNRNLADPFKWHVVWNQAANGYRLPTEAEWEYTCRAGTTTPFNTGAEINASQAHFNQTNTRDVGSFAPNTWGLYDMHGNVREWCWDWFGDYPKTDAEDPTGAVSGDFRITRGGCWNKQGDFMRSAHRNGNAPQTRSSAIGLRLALSC